MCGIAGVYDQRGQGRARLGAVRAMCEAMRHRGPDGDGFYAPDQRQDIAFGMRRLSILDIDGSDQPLYNEDRSLALVFNGEIYNYRELRRTLRQQDHTFRTDGDGETILHLYEQYGIDCFRHLRGMYGLALWDDARGQLILAVDHIGMKPLYVCQHDGLFRFASEVKALLVDPALPRGVDPALIDTFFSFGYMIDTATPFAGISRLPAGHALILRGESQTLHRHWSFGSDRIGLIGVRDYVGEEALIEQVRAQIADSVALHLRSDVPLGLFLSGGIDSAVIAAHMARAGGQVKTYTIGYATPTPDNELDAARRLAMHLGAEHHERVIDAQTWWRGLLTYVGAHNEPNANASAVTLLLLAEETAKHVKVVLTGLGGDELFNGYSTHRTLAWLLREGARWRPLLAPARGLFRAIEGLYPMLKRWRGVGALPTYLPRWYQASLPRDQGLLRAASFDGMVMSDALRARLYTPDLQAAWAQAQHKERAYTSILYDSLRSEPDNTAQALVINTWLAGNALLSQDKVTMAHSLEARVPFFDPPLLASAAASPPALRMRSNKYILREAARGIVPDFAIERPKKPFETPIAGWFSNELRSAIEEVLRDPGARLTPWIDRQALWRLLDAHFDGRAPQVEVVFRLVLFELWLRHFDLRG